MIKNKDTDEEEIVISGSYSFKGTDGLIYRVKYTADRNGYHAIVEPPQKDESEVKLIADGLPLPAAPIL